MKLTDLKIGDEYLAVDAVNVTGKRRARHVRMLRIEEGQPTYRLSGYRRQPVKLAVVELLDGPTVSHKPWPTIETAEKGAIVNIQARYITGPYTAQVAEERAEEAALAERRSSLIDRWAEVLGVEPHTIRLNSRTGIFSVDFEDLDAIEAVLKRLEEPVTMGAV